MNCCVYIFSLSVLFCVICTATNNPHNDNALKSGELQPQLPIRVNNGGKKLTELNADVLYLIFDELELEDVLNLFEAHPTEIFSVIANDIFSKNFKNYLIHIDWQFGPNRFRVDRSANCIIVGKMAPIFLKSFGRSIQNLKLERAPNVITENVNQYTSESLKKLHIYFMDENPLKHFKKPFTKLEILRFHINIRIDTGHLPFDQLFPKLRKLKMQLYTDVDKSIVAHKIPHLEHLNLRVSQLENKQNILQILKTNPQIVSFSVDVLSKDFCNVIREYVSNLRNLSLATVGIDVEDEARFENVKYLKLDPYGKNIDRLSLPKLESLEMFHAPSDSPQWTEFYRKHQHISRLNIEYNDGTYHPIRTLIQMIRRLPNLKEFQVDVLIRCDAFEVIGDIIKGNPNLERINCVSSHISTEKMNKIQEKFGNDWNIVTRNSKHTSEIESLFMEKKN